MIFAFVCILAFVAVSLVSAADNEAITCGSVVKLIHQDSGYYIHSHPIAWGSGSGQQSVTATQSTNEAGSLWVVKDATTSVIACEIGEPIACGAKIRLEHSSTGKNLHSNLFRAALT